MSLGEHLRELRSRLFKSAIAIALFGIVGFYFHEQIIDFMTQPARDAAVLEDRDYKTIYPRVADPLIVPMQLALLSGFILASPVWIYHLWQFITPALYRNEKKWAWIVMATAVPLFLAGVGLALWIMPKAWKFLLSFTPDDVENYVPFTEYLSFFIRIILVFGIGFLLPVFVVLLNAVGVIRHEALSNARRWVIVGIFVFGAVATPTGDPLTLMVLATPMWLLFEVAVLLCRLRDRQRDVRAGRGLADDEATPDEILEQLGRVDSRDDDEDDSSSR
jgi:sec-independent protein translocase protein TatC